jgi:hypothetical protein
MREKRNAYKVLVGNPAGKRPLEDPGLDGRIIKRWAVKKYAGRVWTELIWLRTGTNGTLL